MYLSCLPLPGGATGLWQPCRSAMKIFLALFDATFEYIWCLFHHPNITTNGSIYFHSKRSKKIQKDRSSSTCRSFSGQFQPDTHRPCPDRCCSAQRSCDKTPGTGQDRWGHMAVEGRELQRKHEKTLGSDEYLLPEDTCEDRPCWRSKVG